MEGKVERETESTLERGGQRMAHDYPSRGTRGNGETRRGEPWREGGSRVPHGLSDSGRIGNGEGWSAQIAEISCLWINRKNNSN